MGGVTPLDVLRAGAPTLAGELFPGSLFGAAGGGLGSTDVGNVSHLLPTIQPTVAIGDPGIPGHSRERADSTQTPDGERAILDSSVALALTALEVLTDADLRDRAWAAFPHRPDHKEQP